MNYLTGMGEALAVQNEKTVAALKAGGHLKTIKFGKTKIELPGLDEQTRRKHAHMGASLAGVDAAAPIVWPDMKAVEERTKAARPPMSEEVKEKLRAYTAANPRDIGDQIATMLRACESLDDTYRVAAEYLGEGEPTLREKYTKLNPGQQRMVLGNRMRAKWKKDNLSAEGRDKNAKK